MLGWFERRLDPYPTAEPRAAAARACWRSACIIRKGAKRWLVVMAVCSALIASIEIVLFGFIGNVVDWLSKANRATFLADRRARGWR